MSKTIRKSLLLVLLICLAIAVLLAGCKSTSVNTKEEIVLQIEKEGLTHFGNVKLNMRTRDFFRETDFEYGDAVRVRFLDYDIVVPIVSAFSLLDIGQTGLDAEDLNPEGLSEQILLFINLDDFATNYGIATKTVYDDGSWEWFPCEGIEFPIDVTLTMEEEGAFPEFSGPPMVVYTSRSAYEDLDDYGFTNIRMVTTPGFGNCFYRGCSPIDDKFNRNKYADALLDDIGVDIAINLSDSKNKAEAFEGYFETYYSHMDIFFNEVGVDYMQPSFKKAFADAFRYIADNQGVYYVHCQLGKDRTGIFCAILESLMGASATQVIEDYMQTFLNFYDMEKDSTKYNVISEANICVAMRDLYNLDCDFKDLSTERLHDETVKFLKSAGLTDDEISRLKKNLARVR